MPIPLYEERQSMWTTIVGMVKPWNPLHICRPSKESGKTPKTPIQESSGNDETQGTNATLLIEENFRTPVYYSSDEFYPNTPETGDLQHQTPNAFDTQEEIIIYKRIQTDGCNFRELTVLAKELFGDLFKGWVNVNDITEKGTHAGSVADALEESLYLVYTLNKPMNHCTALHIGKNGVVTYIDSEGPPKVEFHGNLRVNQKRVQDKLYCTCGLHAIWALRELNIHGSCEKLQNSYPTVEETRLYLNDHFVIKEIFIKRLSPPRDIIKKDLIIPTLRLRKKSLDTVEVDVKEEISIKSNRKIKNGEDLKLKMD